MIDNFALVLQKYGGLYLTGLGMTAQLTLLSLAAGFLLSWPLGYALARPVRLLSPLARGFAHYATGTPLLVQLFLIYYGLGQFEAVRDSIFWAALSEPYWCALLAFSLNTAGYGGRIFGGAMKNIPAGDVEAARAFGMTEWQIFHRVLAPLAFRRSIPAYGNEIIFLMHASSLASVVTLLDLTGAARVAARGTFAFSESYLVAIVFYMALTGVIIGAAKYAERRWLTPLTASG